MDYHGLRRLLTQHFGEPRQGKVRDAYHAGTLSHRDIAMRLSYAANRRSIFDIELGFEVEGVGEYLTALDHFFRMQLRERLPGYTDDFLDAGVEIDAYLPTALHNVPLLQRTAVLVSEQSQPKIESVVRYLLTGKGFKQYAELGGPENGAELWGHRLPPGLRDGSVIPGGPIWTPSTKAEKGHDVYLDYREVADAYPGVQELSLAVFGVIFDIADEAGYIAADGKFEGSYMPDGTWRWCDERGTTDSMRCIPKAAYQKQFVEEGGPLPSTRDKEILRKAGKELGIDKLNPENPEDVAYAKTLRFPPEVIAEYRAANEEIFKAFTGHTLVGYQTAVLGIDSW